MSFETSLDRGSHHHLFTRPPLPGRICLYLIDVQFTATTRTVCVEIPVEIWEKIRLIGGDDPRISWWGSEDEDREDIVAARAALAESGSISLEDLKRELELSTVEARLTYKGYTAILEIDEEAGEQFGRVQGIRHIITFQGATVEEARRSFKETIDAYLESCRESGEEHDRPFLGFDREREAYARTKAELLLQAEGRYVVFVGEEMGGPFDDLRSAYLAGRRRFGPGPLYIKQVLAEEPESGESA